MKHDADALAFLQEIEDALVECFDDVTAEDANRRVNEWSRFGDEPIVGDHMIYHESPVYWAKSIYYGRRDWWREHPDEHHYASAPLKERDA